MSKYSFIILHYITIEDTIACVNSIKTIDIIDIEISIVIVDNASPNGTGKLIEKKYKDDEMVSVIINHSNEGFSAGNNIGCEYARRYFDPDFYVVLNNDVVIEQKDFCNIICQIYKNKIFDVLGPDVYNRNINVHQNPLMSEYPNECMVIKTIRVNYLMCKFYPISIPVMFMLKCIERYSKREIQYGYEQENIVLHGACLIFTRNYVEKKQRVFYPETFLYYEESLLQLWNDMNGCRAVYSPEIQVLHNESGATRAEYKNMIARWYRGADNIIKAATIFLNELKKYKMSDS